LVSLGSRMLLSVLPVVSNESTLATGVAVGAS
jgi:hypothetical protein